MKMVDYIYVQAFSFKNYENDDTTLYICIHWNYKKKEEHLELKPETYGFNKKDYNRKIFLDGVLGLQYGSLNDILRILKKTYCSTIGYEFMHMSDPEEKAWVRNRIEGAWKKNIIYW